MDEKLLDLNASSYAKDVAGRLFTGDGDRIIRRAQLEALLENAVLFGEELGSGKALQSAADKARGIAAAVGG